MLRYGSLNDDAMEFARRSPAKSGVKEKATA